MDENYRDWKADRETEARKAHERVEAKSAARRAKRARDWKELKAAAKREFIDSGGSELEFESEWPAIRAELIAGRVSADKQTEREQDTVRTWRA